MTQKKIYSVGIDVSKNSLHFCAVDALNNVIETGKLKNNRDDINTFVQFLKTKKLHNQFRIALEATSSYHLLPALIFKDNFNNIKVFNPILTKKFASSSIRKSKSDKIDAQIIAQIGIFEDIPNFDMKPEAFLMRRKINSLHKLKQQKQVLTNSIKQLEHDHNSLDIPLSPAFKELNGAIKKLNSAIVHLQKEINQFAKEQFEVLELIQDIPGVSTDSAATILAFIFDKKFHSKNAITAFAGLDISTKLSGTSVHKRGALSKRGNPILRKALFQAAWGLFMHQKHFKKLALDLKNNGKHYFEILIIFARKLLHIIYGISKSKMPFDINRI